MTKEELTKQAKRYIDNTVESFDTPFEVIMADFTEKIIKQEKQKVLQYVENWINTKAPRPMNVNQASMRMDMSDFDVARCGLDTVVSLFESLKRMKK